MTEVLNSLQGTICMMDDILVYVANEEEHSQYLYAVLNCFQEASITLNQSKCQFNGSHVFFCGYLISAKGLQPEPVKTEALNKMHACQTVAEV